MGQRYPEPSTREKVPLFGPQICRYSQPISSARSTVGVWGINITPALHELATGAHGGRLSLTSGISAGHVAASLVFVILGSISRSLGNGLGVLLVLVDGPVEDVIILEGLTNEEITENLSEVRVIGLVVEAERPSVVQVHGELIGEPTAKNLGGSSHLLFHDTVVLLLLGGSLQALPGERSTAEVEHDIAEGLHVVTARLFDTQMGIYTGITGGTSQILVLTVRNVEVSLGVTVFLGEAKIDHIDLVSTLSNTHQEVIRLDIAVDERFGVDIFDTGDELIGQEQNSLQGEFSVAKVEEIFQTRAEKVDNHGIIIALGTEPTDEGNADTTSEGLVDTGLIFELRVLGFDAFELDSNLFAGNDVRTYPKSSVVGRHTSQTMFYSIPK